MKKQFASILITALILSCFTACSTGDLESLPGTSDPISDSSSSSENTSAASKSESSSSDAALTPLSFTDEDLELQEILGGLMSNGAGTVYYWFVGLPFKADADTAMQKIRISNSQHPNEVCNFFLIPENLQDDTLTIPTTYVEMENLLGRFFTKQATEKYMESFGKGTVTGESDGVLDVTLDGKNAGISPIFLEANGQLYRVDAVGTNILNMDSSTARVTAKGEGIIEFTYLPYHYEYQENTEFAYEETYPTYAQTGYIVLEDGIWKLPYWSYGGFEKRGEAGENSGS